MKRILIIIVMLVTISAKAQWQPDVRLTNASGNSYTFGNNPWCVASSGSFLHVVWYDNRDGNDEIYYKRSTDAGLTWGTDTRLTNDTLGSFTPSIAVSGSLLHVVWNDIRDGGYKIYYKRSTDGGTSWGADIRLTNSISYSESPSIAVSNSNVHVVWSDSRAGNYEIYYKQSTDGGTTWGADTRLTNNTADSFDPSITISGSLVHIVWKDDRDGNWEIYNKSSTDSGVNWGADIRLTNNNAYSVSPSIAISGSLVHVVWQDERIVNSEIYYDYEIYYKRSTDGGITWGVDTRLTNSTVYSVSPSIAVSGSRVHIVWYDNRDGNYEIYYKSSTDGGINWNADTRLTNNDSDSWRPSILVSGSVVHVVWSDKRDGNWEIYYKRNPTGNVGIQNISTETPSKYSLSQNYPNPFNPSTKIKFAMPKAGDVKIVVYDIMGREVQTLVNERLQAGTYEATFDGSALNSGVYFYKLTNGTFSETKKMLLLK